MVCRALGEGAHLELWNGCWLVDDDKLLLRLCIMVRLLPLLENDKQIAKSAVLAPKSFTRSVFRLLRVIRLSRGVLSGSCETASMMRRALRGRALGAVEWMLAGQRRQATFTFVYNDEITSSAGK